MEAIRVSNKRLACDAPGCNYTEAAELSESLIGKPCPLCGNNLLTADAYKVAKASLDAVEAINGIFAILDDSSVVPEYGPKITATFGEDGGPSIKLALAKPSTSGHRT